MTSAPADDDERRLVAAAVRGDRDAYGALLARHLPVTFRVACLVAGSAADAEEAVQEASIKAWLALARFRQGAPFRPWLVQIAINEARNRRRSSGRRAGLALRVAAGEARAATAPSAEEVTVGAQERRRLAAAVEALGEADQLVIAARSFLGLSEAETASALGIRRGTVKSRLSRALERLRTQLGEEGV